MTNTALPPDAFEVGEIAYYVGDGKIYKHKIIQIIGKLRHTQIDNHLLEDCLFYKNYWDAYAQLVKNRKANDEESR